MSRRKQAKPLRHLEDGMAAPVSVNGESKFRLLSLRESIFSRVDLSCSLSSPLTMSELSANTTSAYRTVPRNWEEHKNVRGRETSLLLLYIKNTVYSRG